MRSLRSLRPNSLVLSPPWERWRPAGIFPALDTPRPLCENFGNAGMPAGRQRSQVQLSTDRAEMSFLFLATTNALNMV
jgi:hypothetical protein